MSFSTEDLIFWKGLCGSRDIYEANLEIHPMTLGDLIYRLECAEAIIVRAEKYTNIFNELIPLKEDLKAWRQSKGEI